MLNQYTVTVFHSYLSETNYPCLLECFFFQLEYFISYHMWIYKHKVFLHLQQNTHWFTYTHVCSYYLYSFLNVVAFSNYIFNTLRYLVRQSDVFQRLYLWIIQICRQTNFYTMCHTQDKYLYRYKYQKCT